MYSFFYISSDFVHPRFSFCDKSTTRSPMYSSMLYAILLAECQREGSRRLDAPSMTLHPSPMSVSTTTYDIPIELE